MTMIEPPMAGPETDTLLGALERQRGYLAWKCGGLDADGLHARLGPSAITLGGLLKHMAVVEDDLFSVKLFGNEPRWDQPSEWEWETGGDSPDELTAMWQDAARRSRELVGRALADGGLDRKAAHVWPDGRTPSLRRLLIDMIEEYARHVGHADLIRESVDGLVGEDPAD